MINLKVVATMKALGGGRWLGEILVNGDVAVSVCGSHDYVSTEIARHHARWTAG